MPHSAKRKHVFLGETKQMSKSKKIAPRKKFYFGLLHHILVHKYTISFMDGYNEKICKDIELRIDPDHFFTSCQIYSMNKKARYKNSLKPSSPFKWVLWVLF